MIKVGVVGANNGQWDTVNKLLEADNIRCEMVEFAKYKLPNNALDAGEIDLNAFQHKACLQKEIDDLGYDIAVLGDTIVAPPVPVLRQDHRREPVEGGGQDRRAQCPHQRGPVL